MRANARAAFPCNVFPIALSVNFLGIKLIKARGGVAQGRQRFQIWYTNRFNFLLRLEVTGTDVQLIRDAYGRAFALFMAPRIRGANTWRARFGNAPCFCHLAR